MGSAEVERLSSTDRLSRRLVDPKLMGIEVGIDDVVGPDKIYGAREFVLVMLVDWHRVGHKICAKIDPGLSMLCEPGGEGRVSYSVAGFYQLNNHALAYLGSPKAQGLMANEDDGMLLWFRRIDTEEIKETIERRFFELSGLHWGDHYE